MSKRLDENLGSVGFDNLINGTFPPAEPFTVKIKQGQGTLKRGSLLATSEDGMELIGDTTTGKANAVLAEDVDTGMPTVKTQEDDEKETTPKEIETVTGIAYRTGHFNTEQLIVAEGYTITSEDKEALRTVGILLSDAVEV